MPGWNLGPTAGYRAAEVRAGHPNLMIVRWHNIGTSTLTGTVDLISQQLQLAGALPVLVDLLPSAPATLYYDVPAGEYSLTEERMDAQGAVFKQDWTVTAAPPPLVIPPTLPDPNALQGLIMSLPGLLQGFGVPALPVPVP